MKRLFRQVIIQICMFIITILPIFLFTQLFVQPMWETTWCGKHYCRTIEHHIMYSRQEFADFPVNKKELLEIYEQKDKIFHMSYYYLRTPNDRYIFSSGYFSKINAIRDLKSLKNNDFVQLSKKNVGLIQTLCIGIYIILICIGIMITMLTKEIQNQENKKADT